MTDVPVLTFGGFTQPHLRQQLLLSGRLIRLRGWRQRKRE